MIADRLRPVLLLVLLATACGAGADGPSPSPAAHISSQPGSIILTGTLEHVGGKPAPDVCVVLGPATINCAATTDSTGRFEIAVPKDASVNWTVRYLVDGQELGRATVSGPFDTDTVRLPMWTLP